MKCRNDNACLQSNEERKSRIRRLNDDLQVEQLGSIACHTGRESCFYLRFDQQQWNAVDPVIKAPSDIYKK